MYSRVIRLDNAVLAYDVTGRGSHALLLFHGAGQNRAVFNDLPDELLSRYRLYAFDLFFHGESLWQNEAPITNDQWRRMLDVLCDQEQIDRLSVLGYSIGGRFALATLQVMPDRVQQCFLVAPDGLLSNPWFDLATQTRFGRTIFKKLMTRPGILQRVLPVAGWLRLVDPRMLRFIAHQLDTEEKRTRIFLTWTSFRLLRFDEKTLQRSLNAHGVTLAVFLATHDSLISASKVRHFLKRLKSVHLEVINANHRRVLSKATERIAHL